MCYAIDTYKVMGYADRDRLTTLLYSALHYYI